MTPPTSTTPPTTATDLGAIKQTQQQTWSSGDYAVVATRIQFVAEQLAESAELRAGSRVLDVAAGSGNAAIAAARSGTSVVAVDYVPELLATGRERAAAEGFDIEFVEGDAEDLPVATADYDAVLSVFGVMFAPDHQRAADEIVRACRPGGTVALASWVPDGFIADMFRTMSRYVPPPAGLRSPMLWGDEDHLFDLFGDTLTDVRSARRVCTFRYESPADFAGFFRRYYGPTLRAFGRLDATTQEAMFADLAALAADADVHRDGGSIAVPAVYLETVARRA